MSVRIININWEKIDLPTNVKANLFMIAELMKEYDWKMTNYHKSNYILNLKRGRVKMNVYLSTLTIQTSMNHPTKGRTQLNRKNLKPSEVKKIFKNPRVHTGKGYHYKRK